MFSSVVKPSSERLKQAFITLRSQKTRLYRQLEQLIQKSISLYDVGTSLSILPSDTHLRHLLASAHADLRLLLQQDEEGFDHL